MWNFTKKRQTAGNICLVLFTAFILTILVTPYTMVQNAEAAVLSSNGVTTMEGPTTTPGGDQITVNETASGYQLLVNLAGKPLSVFDTLRVDFVNANGTILSVYGNDANNATYQTYSAVYGWVYSLVYDAPSSFYVSADNQVYGKVYLGSEYLYSVILTLNPLPPISSPGSSSSSTPTTTTTTTTDTGTITVDTSGDVPTATVEVDTAKVEAMINSNQDIVIEAVPAGTSVAEVKVELAASILNTLADKSKELSIKTDDVQFVIPPAALDVAALQDLLNADPDAKVTLSVKEVAQPAAVTGTANLQPVGKVFSFELVAQSSTGETKVISTFAKALRVAIPYTVDDLNGVSESKLGAYRVTVNGLVFLGGDVDTDKKVVWFETGSFSEYLLMAKIAAFADIVQHWAKADIELLVDKGIVKGMTASNFAPDASITRAQFATLLVKALGLAEVKPAKATFKDVKPNAWYYGTVEAAAAKGLVAGFNGSFNPEGKITRQEMAVMVANALQVGGKKVSADTSILNKFSDKAQIDTWAKSSIAVAVQEGIITGRTETTVVPKANATRAEGTVMIKKVLSSLGKL